MSGDGYCSIDTELKPLVAAHFRENYFPRYISQMACGGCRASDRQCQEKNQGCFVEEKVEGLDLLKRIEGQCDEDGFEKWVVDNKTKYNAVVACSCHYNMAW